MTPRDTSCSTSASSADPTCIGDVQREKKHNLPSSALMRRTAGFSPRFSPTAVPRDSATEASCLHHSAPDISFHSAAPNWASRRSMYGLGSSDAAAKPHPKGAQAMLPRSGKTRVVPITRPVEEEAEEGSGAQVLSQSGSWEKDQGGRYWKTGNSPRVADFSQSEGQDRSVARETNPAPMRVPSSKPEGTLVRASTGQSRIGLMKPPASRAKGAPVRVRSSQSEATILMRRQLKARAKLSPTQRGPSLALSLQHVPAKPAVSPAPRSNYRSAVRTELEKLKGEVGLPAEAAPDQVRLAFQKSLREAHPDNGGDAATFERVILQWDRALRLAALLQAEEERQLLRQQHKNGQEQFRATVTLSGMDVSGSAGAGSLDHGDLQSSQRSSGAGGGKEGAERERALPSRTQDMRPEPKSGSSPHSEYDRKGPVGHKGGADSTPRGGLSLVGGGTTASLLRGPPDSPPGQPSRRRRMRMDKAKNLTWQDLSQDARNGWDSSICTPTAASEGLDAPGFSDVLELSPGSAARRGDAAFSLGEYGAAVEAYSVAMVQQPGDAGLLLCRSAAQHKKGSFAQALSDARRAARLRPTWPKAHYRIGLAHSAMDHPAAAVAAFRTALELQEDPPPRLVALTLRAESVLSESQEVATLGSPGAGVSALAFPPLPSGSTGSDHHHRRHVSFSLDSPISFSSLRTPGSTPGREQGSNPAPTAVLPPQQVDADGLAEGCQVAALSRGRLARCERDPAATGEVGIEMEAIEAPSDRLQKGDCMEGGGAEPGIVQGACGSAESNAATGAPANGDEGAAESGLAAARDSSSEEESADLSLEQLFSATETEPANKIPTGGSLPDFSPASSACQVSVNCDPASTPMLELDGTRAPQGGAAADEREGAGRAQVASGGGGLMATGSQDGTVRLWDTATWLCLQELSQHTGNVTQLCWAPGGALLASASVDGTVCLWQVIRGQTKEGKAESEEAEASTNGRPGSDPLGPDATCEESLTPGMPAGAETTAVQEGGQGETQRGRTGLDGQEASVEGWKEVRNGLEDKEGVSEGFSGTEARWEKAREEAQEDFGEKKALDGFPERQVASLRWILSGHKGRIEAVSFNRDGRWILTASADKSAVLWDAGTGAMLHSYKGHSQSVTSIAISSNDALLATASEDGSTQIWDVDTEESLHIVGGQGGVAKACPFFSYGDHLEDVGKHFLATWHQSGESKEGWIHLWFVQQSPSTDSVDEPRLTVVERTEVHIPESISVVEFLQNENGAILAGVALSNGSISVWNLCSNGSRGQCLHILQNAQNNPRKSRTLPVFHCLSFSPSGHFLAGCSTDRRVKIWRLSNGELEHWLKGHSKGVRYLAWSADGRHLASTSLDSTVRIWNGEVGEASCA